MSECLSAGRRSLTRATEGCGRWKSVGPDCPSHYRWCTPTESGHIYSAAQTPDSYPEAVKRLNAPFPWLDVLSALACHLQGTAASDASPRTLLVGDEGFR